MPLLFRSMSHGTVAFGFFNIETDMMLLDTMFFFADDFSRSIAAMAAGGAGDMGSYRLQPHQVGNLMGAIHGVDHGGFLGNVYRRFPFPREPRQFRQKPDGYRNRPIIEEIMGRYTHAVTMRMSAGPSGKEAAIEEYLFDREGFQDLIVYLWEGGYPRWGENIRPRCVLEMKEAIARSAAPLFEGLVSRLS